MIVKLFEQVLGEKKNTKTFTVSLCESSSFLIL